MYQTFFQPVNIQHLLALSDDVHEISVLVEYPLHDWMTKLYYIASKHATYIIEVERLLVSWSADAIYLITIISKVDLDTKNDNWWSIGRS